MAKTKELEGDALLQALAKHGMDVLLPKDSSSLLGWLDTGNYALNWAVSGRFLRGWPLGHVVEIFGDPGSGKSYLLAYALANAQKASGVTFLDDTERRFNGEWASRALGVNLKRLAMRHSETVEEHRKHLAGFVSALKAIGISKPSVAALDSLALLATEHELKSPDKRDMSRPGEIRKLFRILAHAMSELPIAYLVANHKIASMDAYSRPESGGGSGTKYQATVRVDLLPSTHVKDASGDPVGRVVLATVVKNSLVSPWRKVRFYIPYHERAHAASGLIPILLQYGIIEVKGKNLVYQEEDTKIKANSSTDAFVKQGISGVQLLEKYPDLLQRADKILQERDAARWEGAVVDIPDLQEADDAAVAVEGDESEGE